MFGRDKNIKRIGKDSYQMDFPSGDVYASPETNYKRAATAGSLATLFFASFLTPACIESKKAEASSNLSGDSQSSETTKNQKKSYGEEKTKLHPALKVKDLKDYVLDFTKIKTKEDFERFYKKSTEEQRWFIGDYFTEASKIEVKRYKNNLDKLKEIGFLDDLEEIANHQGFMISEIKAYDKNGKLYTKYYRIHVVVNDELLYIDDPEIKIKK